MKTSAVDQTQRSIALRGRKPAAKGSTSFAAHLDTAASENSAQTPSITSVIIEGLIGLQEYGDETSGGGQHQARQHGESILEHLELIRQDLLLGRVPLPRLRQLADVLNHGAKLQLEPRLRDILEEIELRAHIELAKLGAEL
ncbi:MAG: flagellar assembly protein FliX [Hyphomicrobiales bacterium]|nr:flagellar assembly protein FliX [Hyphomicrobiales bacterium]